MSESVNDSLTGHFMVALPGLKTEVFQEAVIFICHHDSSGAMGLVINQPINGLDLADIVHNPVSQNNDDSDPEIFWGGPVNMEKDLFYILPKSADPAPCLSMPIYRLLRTWICWMVQKTIHLHPNSIRPF